MNDLSTAEKAAMNALWDASNTYGDWVRENCEGATQDRINADVGRLMQAGFALGKAANILAATFRESNYGSDRPALSHLGSLLSDGVAYAAEPRSRQSHVIRAAMYLELAR